MGWDPECVARDSGGMDIIRSIKGRSSTALAAFASVLVMSALKTSATSSAANTTLS